MREQILCYALRYDGDYKKIQKAMEQQEPWEHVCFHGHYVTIDEDHYPSRLRCLEFAPWILFYEGELALCDQPCCSVIGSRLASKEGLDTTKSICNLIKKRYVLVSGLAKGIDTEVHKTALSTKTIGVIGCGIDVNYPKENSFLYTEMQRNHLILSEYPPGSKPYAYHFPWRNRIIAALSSAVVVIEAKKKSGTLLTVNEAITLDIPVYCVPQKFGNPAGEGCNLLISQGAFILVDEEDVLQI